MSTWKNSSGFYLEENPIDANMTPPIANEDATLTFVNEDVTLTDNINQGVDGEDEDNVS